MVNTTPSPNAGLMLAQRFRRWPNISPALVEWLGLAVTYFASTQLPLADDDISQMFFDTFHDPCDPLVELSQRGVSLKAL